MSGAIEMSSGSQWRRWDPHIHAPGTIMNDQFRGADPWDTYLAELESRAPVIEALGITDYYSTDTYVRVCEAKANGRLQNVKLIFPNIEMRLNVGTPGGNWVNIHLLVRPDDPKHLDEIHRFLSGLEFRAHNDRFTISRNELIRLGNKGGITDELAALKEGSEQFKVNFEDFRERIKMDWIRRNTVIALSGNADGTSDLRGADATLRQEIERTAHVMFVSNPKSRDFWLGNTDKMSREMLEQTRNGRKPCLHGSDAHTHADIGNPALNRYSWVKGDPTFDSLIQACLDPERAFVGVEPPSSANPSQIISQVEISDAPWASPSLIPLNSGLVAIIGARGSGKTALAELIAVGCDAIPAGENNRSFVHRAREFLTNTDISITWANQEVESRPVSGAGQSELAPRARYLSQQFVDNLCAADGVTDELLREVKRVVFEAHSLSDRDGAIDFDDLLGIRASRFRRRREQEEDRLANIAERIGEERDKHASMRTLAGQKQEKEALIARLTSDRSKLVKKGSEAVADRINALTAAADKVRGHLRRYTLREQDLLGLQDEIEMMIANGAVNELQDLRERHPNSGINDENWQLFRREFQGPVNELLADQLKITKKNSTSWRGLTVTAGDVETALIADDAPLEEQSLALLDAEIQRLNQIVAIDKATVNRYADLSKQITTETEQLSRINEKLEDAKGAAERVKGLIGERQDAYARVFEAIASEQNVLNDLYAPIKSRLNEAEGTLRKLTFSVTRSVDLDQWAEAGERFVDLRNKGPLKGQGTLKSQAEKYLLTAWRRGDAKAATAAMEAFRTENDEDLIAKARVQRGNTPEFRSWTKGFAKWLYSTDHISLHYSVDYDGIDIRNLSPGTRGIVLLLLYLELDDNDGRPLIIDQPEENLDPKSIFDELVGLFQIAKSKRQVIMVTHNANLVVNADADQIIVASVGPHEGGSLPPISYVSGGLDDRQIRDQVCDILEGGARAFKERARRLRLAWR
jgi:predicted ATPase